MTIFDGGLAASACVGLNHNRFVVVASEFLDANKTVIVDGNRGWTEGLNNDWVSDASDVEAWQVQSYPANRHPDTIETEVLGNEWGMTFIALLPNDVGATLQPGTYLNTRRVGNAEIPGQPEFDIRHRGSTPCEQGAFEVLELKSVDTANGVKLTSFTIVFELDCSDSTYGLVDVSRGCLHMER